jgi:catalase
MLRKLQLQLFVAIISLAMGIAARRRKGRATHPVGIGASGKAKVVDRFPPHEFFKAGREFSVIVRHAQVGTEDDAASDVRSAALRLTSAGQSFDLVMNTGEAGTFWDLPTFLDFMRATAAAGAIEDVGDKPSLEAFYRKYPLSEQTTANRMRRAPSTFTQMYYHSQTVFRFIAQDGTLYYVKYRLAPADKGAETGLLGDEDRKHIWLQARLPDEKCSTDYLRQEFKTRITSAPVTYHLQIQLKRPTPNEDKEIFNSCRAWNDEWLDLATVTLDRLLPDAETDKLRFNVANQPTSLGLLPAESIYDYNAVNYARSQAYKMSQWVRG